MVLRWRDPEFQAVLKAARMRMHTRWYEGRIQVKRKAGESHSAARHWVRDEVKRQRIDQNGRLRCIARIEAGLPKRRHYLVPSR